MRFSLKRPEREIFRFLRLLPPPPPGFSPNLGSLLLKLGCWFSRESGPGGAGGRAGSAGGGGAPATGPSLVFFLLLVSAFHQEPVAAVLSAIFSRRPATAAGAGGSSSPLRLGSAHLGCDHVRGWEVPGALAARLLCGRKG